MEDTLDIVREFLVESHENLDQLDRDLVALEQDPRSRDLLSSIFRTIHTIKGTCGFLGFGKLEKVAHVGENLLSKLRDGELLLDPEITSGLLAQVDAIRSMLNFIESDGSEGLDEYASLCERLTQLQQSTGATSTIAQASAEGNSPHGAAACQEQAKLIDSSATDAMAEPSTTLLGDLLVANKLSTPETIGEALQAQVAGDNRPLGQLLVERGDATPEQVSEAVKSQQEARLAESNIRVDVGLLDKLMNQVGELVLARNQILQFTSTLTDSTFLSTSQRLNLITTELQEGVMKTRMQPIGNIWSKFPRVVRDLAVQCGKRVRIEMEGKETELDKTIIESIKDPLTHLVRNSVDHGIESPEQRADHGKPEEGRLLLRAFHEGGQVIIEITDDGGGLNLERIRQKAVERGLVTQDQVARLGDRDTAMMIFAPGFSTAAKVTNVSGRGVGMDVVKTNVEKIGGTVDIQTQAGEGTTVRLKIPLRWPSFRAGRHFVARSPRHSASQFARTVRLGNRPRMASSDCTERRSTGCGQLLPVVYLRANSQLTPQRRSLSRGMFGRK